MSYPKKATKAKGTKADKEWEKQKDKNYGVQKRDQLKSLLLNKFKTKYAAELKDPKQEQLVSGEVTKFVSQSTLTEANLQKLDARIGELLSHKSPAKKSAEPKKEPIPQGKQESPQKPETLKSPHAETVPKTGEDDWACIVDYNKKLFQEEQQALLAKKKDMKTKLKEELDKQVEVKKKIEEEKTKKEREVEERQVKLESELERKDRAKDLKQKEVTLKHRKDAQKVFEGIQPRPHIIS